MTRLYISPHLDDVAWSCAGHIAQQIADGERIVVATVFSRGDDARRVEDAAAVAAVGASSIHLPFDDAPVRLGCRATFRALMLQAPLHAPTVQAVATSIAELIEREAPTTVWWPLGIGGHIDHRTVFAASRRLAGTWHYYEDRPYAFVPALVQLRRLELEGGELRAPPSTSQIDAQLHAGGVDALLTRAERSSVVADFARQLRTVHPGVGVAWHSARLRVERGVTATATAWIDAYRSQIAAFRWGASSADLWRANRAIDAEAFVERAVHLASIIKH
jgi:LmbE family N-acetylglucosaminyl deacetylase